MNVMGHTCWKAVIGVFAVACAPVNVVPDPAFGALHCPSLPKAGDTDAPAAVLYERNPWLMAVGSDFPTAAIWRDGLAVFLHSDAKGNVEARQTMISPAEASRIADKVAATTRGVPAFTSVLDVSDQKTVEVVVHDGEVWRVAAIYGLTRDGARAPGHFMNAYRELLALDRPDSVPFEPVDLQILFWAFEYAKGDPVPWPEDVPSPPADNVPAEREPGDPVAYSFVVASKYAASLRLTQQTAHATQPTRAIGFNGHKWTVSLVSRFRGQDAIDRVLHCSRRPDKGR